MKNYLRLIAILIAFGLVAVACGDDDDAPEAVTATDDSSDTASADTASADTASADTASADTASADTGSADTGGDPGAEGLARAQEIADASTVPPTTINQTVPLTGVPEPKTVAWMECEFPACQEITPGFEAATAALGWELEVITIPSFEPQAGLQQAIDAGVDFIGITGTPRALYEDQLAAANAAGIPIVQCYNVDDVDPDAGLHMQCADETQVDYEGYILGNWIIADSGGAANVLMVQLPDFSILLAEEDGGRRAFEENCPGCNFEALNITGEDLGSGAIPGKIVSALQNDPSINYLWFAFGDLPLGVTDALTDAGLLEQVKQVGVDFSIGVGLEEFVGGTNAAWTANPKPYAAWTMVDAMARLSLGMELTEERAAAALATFIIDDIEFANQVKDTGWVGPDGMEDQFKALWGVG